MSTARRGDGVSARRRKRRRPMPEPPHVATRAELDRWLAAHQHVPAPGGDRVNTPTPAQLAESLTDVGRGFTAEMPGLGTPDPALGRHLMQMASRVAQRVAVDDPRLAAFAPWTDSRGYTWLDTADDLVPVLARAQREHRSFERWFTAVADAMAARTTAPTADELAEWAEQMEQMERAARAGFRITYAGPGGIGMRRDPEETR